MIGTLTAFLITYWYYKSAQATGKNPLSSAGFGFLAYLIPCVLWTVTVTPGLRDAVDHNPSTVSGLLVNYAYIVVGAACAIGIKLKRFKAPKQ